MNRLSLRTLGTGLASLALAAQAHAFAPIDDHSYLVSLPVEMAAPIYSQPSTGEAAGLISGWNSFVTGEGQRWLVAGYRADLGAPATLMGPGIPLISASASNDEVGRAATRFLTDHARMLNLNPSELSLLEVLPNGDRTQVIFLQMHDGLEVVGGRAEVFLFQGKVVSFGSEFYPNVSAFTTPALSEDEAKRIAVSGLPFGSSANDRFEGSARLVIQPIQLEGRLSYYLAYEVKAHTDRPAGEWWSYVDASDGQLLSRENAIHTFDIPVSVKSDVEMKTTTDPYIELGNPDERVTANSTTSYTDANGNVTLVVPNNQSYTVTSDLSGRWANVNRTDGGDASFSGAGSPGVPLNIKWSDSNSQVQERDAYYHTNVVHSWIKALDPAFTGMDFACGNNLNLPPGGGGGDPCNSGCNAYWNGSSLNFCAATGNCANTAQIADVVYHEYGHGITQFTYSPSAPPNASGMNEGFSDIAAMCIQDDPFMGEGFTTGSQYLRNGNNLRQYPGTECGGEIHCLGEIIMGAMWKTRVNLQNSLGHSTGSALMEQLHRATWKNKQFSMPNYLSKLLLNDDNNGDVADGTPHYYDICDAFAAHNLPCPNITKYIQFTHTALDDQTSTVTPYQVTSLVQSVSAGNLVASSIQCFYSLNRGQTWSSVQMTATGNPNEYRANIPAQPCGGLVYYYLFAQTDVGITGTEPARAPLKNVNIFMTGSSVTSLNDTFETNTGWTIGAPGDGATDGIWQRVDPVGKTNTNTGESVQPEDDHTPTPGVLCYVTDGSGGFYQNHDVDGGRTTILSPTFDWSGASGTGKVEIWAFFANEVVVDDTLRVSVSNNNGTSWTDVIKVYGKDSNAWNKYRSYFTSTEVPFTNQMRFRVQASDFNSSLVEAAVDDIVVRHTTCTSVGVEEPTLPARFAIEQNRPNPFHGSTSITFALPQNGSVRVEVFDASGRLVRTVAQGDQTAGVHSVQWDAKDNGGRSVGAGVYYYKVSNGAKELTKKMLLLK